MLYVSCESFIPILLFFQNLGGWFGVLLFFFFQIYYFLVFYHYITLRSSIIFCLCFGDIFLSLGILYHLHLWLFLNYSLVMFFRLVILLSYYLATASAILLPIKSPFPSDVFWIAFFEAVLSVSVVDCLAWLRRFWLYLPFTFLLIFLPIFLPIFLQIFDI